MPTVWPLRRRNTHWWLVAAGSLLVGFLLYLPFRYHAFDDPFITFRYAENVRSGVGFVYNSGERVLSTTTPLYALLLAGLSHLWPDLPRLSNLISALSLALGGVFLYLLGHRWRAPAAGVVAAVLFPFFPLMISTFGAETCFYVMLVLGAFALHAGEQYQGAMALAALATLTRSDGVLVAALLGLHLLVRQRRIPWRPLLLYALLIAPWYLFSWVYFGSPFPVTLGVKQHQAQMAISDSFAQGLVRLLKAHARKPLYWLHGALAVVGTGYALSKARRWLPLFSWAVLYFGAYTLLGVSRYFWYYAPLVPAGLAAVGLGVVAARHWLSSALDGKWPRVAMPIVLLLLLLWPQANGLWYLRHHPDQRARIYREVGTWLAENSAPDAAVGALEVGIIGYYAHRRIIDFAGLIQPNVARHMERETTYQDTALWAVHRYQPDYLVLNPDWFPILMEDVVAPLCVPAQVFSDRNYPGELVTYACQWPAPGQ